MCSVCCDDNVSTQVIEGADKRTLTIKEGKKKKEKENKIKNQRHLNGGTRILWQKVIRKDDEKRKRNKEKWI